MDHGVRCGNLLRIVDDILSVFGKIDAANNVREHKSLRCKNVTLFIASDGKRLIVIERTQRLTPDGMPKLAQGFCLNLSNALSGNIEEFADFFERMV